MIRGEFLGLLGAASVAQAIPYTTSIRIALVAPQTGEAADAGKQLAAGAQGAVEYINRYLPTFGTALTLTVFDDQNEPGEAIVQAGFVAGAPDIVAVIGDLSGDATFAALPTYANGRLALVMPTITDDRLTAQGYRNVFRLATRDSDEGRLLGDAVILAGVRAPVVVQGDGPHAAAVASGVVRQAGARHMSAPLVTLAAAGPVAAAVARAVLADTPDAIVLCGGVDDLGPVLGALRAQGYTGALYASQGFFDARTTKEYGKEAEGIVISTDVPYFPATPTVHEQVGEYEQRYGAMTPLAAYGYAAVQVIDGAITRLGSANRLSLVQGIATGGPFSTVTGLYSFNPYGDPIDPNVYFYTVKAGAFAYLRQAHPGGFSVR